MQNYITILTSIEIASIPIQVSEIPKEILKLFREEKKQEDNQINWVILCSLTYLEQA